MKCDAKNQMDSVAVTASGPVGPRFPAPRASAAQFGSRSVVLVGLMGVGKSTVGRRLASRLGLPFVDADVEIEQASGMTIAEIFERYGEASFRDGERRVIARLLGGPRQILATGGGAFVDPQTRALILAQATAVWLDADVTTLVERVRRRNTRPLLKGRDAAAVLSELAAVRNPLYAEAQVHINSRPSPHEVTVKAIIAALAAAPAEA
jgi:shikimate kinase